METKKEFFKGVLGFTESDEELLARKAEESVYYWWWMFMRIHPVFWYARTKGINPADPRTCEIYKLAGDLSHHHFYQWWNETGREIFAETKKIPEVMKINIFELEKHPFKEKNLYLDIPLNISRRKIMKEIKRELDKVHLSVKLNVADHSTAKLKLFTKKYRLKTLENEYWVLLYKMLHSKIRMWQIGDRLQLAPRLKVRGRLKDEIFGPKYNQLNSLTSRYYFKAKNMSDNLIVKEFPNYQKKSQQTRELMPFGEVHHENYLQSTKLEADRRQDIKKKKTAQEKLDERNIVHSEFHQWLVENFASSIKWEIIRRNNIENSYKNFSANVHRKLPNFITGLDDQLF